MILCHWQSHGASLDHTHQEIPEVCPDDVLCYCCLALEFSLADAYMVRQKGPTLLDPCLACSACLAWRLACLAYLAGLAGLAWLVRLSCLAWLASLASLACLLACVPFLPRLACLLACCLRAFLASFGLLASLALLACIHSFDVFVFGGHSF